MVDFARSFYFLAVAEVEWLVWKEICEMVSLNCKIRRSGRSP